MVTSTGYDFTYLLVCEASTLHHVTKNLQEPLQVETFPNKWLAYTIACVNHKPDKFCHTLTKWVYELQLRWFPDPLGGVLFGNQSPQSHQFTHWNTRDILRIVGGCLETNNIANSQPTTWFFWEGWAPHPSLQVWSPSCSWYYVVSLDVTRHCSSLQVPYRSPPNVLAGTYHLAST